MKITVVLILVVMEDGLVLCDRILLCIMWSVCLNPCCNGRWSRTHRRHFDWV